MIKDDGDYNSTTSGRPQFYIILLACRQKFNERAHILHAKGQVQSLASSVRAGSDPCQQSGGSVVNMELNGQCFESVWQLSVFLCSPWHEFHNPVTGVPWKLIRSSSLTSVMKTNGTKYVLCTIPKYSHNVQLQRSVWCVLVQQLEMTQALHHRQ